MRELENNYIWSYVACGHILVKVFVGFVLFGFLFLWLFWFGFLLFCFILVFLGVGLVWGFLN